MNKKESPAQAVNELSKVFTFDPSSTSIRVQIVNDEPYFVGRDVAIALGYSNPVAAISQHVDNEDSVKHAIPDNQGFMQQTTLINESGLYALIFGSKLQTAKQFKRWVTSEVLPSLRRRGFYGIQRSADSDFIDARDMPYDEYPVNGFNVRSITIDGTVWASVNDINKAIHASTGSYQVVKKLNAKQTLAVKIWLYGNTHPAWFTNELGLKLILSGSRKLRNANQLVLPMEGGAR